MFLYLFHSPTKLRFLSYKLERDLFFRLYRATAAMTSVFRNERSACCPGSFSCCRPIKVHQLIGGLLQPDNLGLCSLSKKADQITVLQYKVNRIQTVWNEPNGRCAMTSSKERAIQLIPQNTLGNACGDNLHT